MKPALIEGATHNPGAPRGMEDTCGRLPIRVVEHEGTTYCISAWKPGAEELKLLAEGGYIVLQVAGWQVPVALTVADRTQAQELL